MSAQTFGLHLAERRDHGLRIEDSWAMRLGQHTDRIVPFRLWPLVPLEKLTVYDVEWALVAAAMHRFATHLELRFRHSLFDPPADPDMVFDLLYELEMEGFSTMDIHGETEHDASEHYFRLSLFSSDEFKRIQKYS